LRSIGVDGHLVCKVQKIVLILLSQHVINAADFKAEGKLTATRMKEGR